MNCGSLGNSLGGDHVDQGFPKGRRLRKRREFLALQNAAGRIGLVHFLLLLRVRGDDQPTRLGITVTRRYGCAVVRNRLKRLVREAFRLHPDLAPSGMDLVIVAKTGVDHAEGLAAVCDELLGASGRLRRQAARLRYELAKTPGKPQTGASTEGSSS